MAYFVGQKKYKKSKKKLLTYPGDSDIIFLADGEIQVSKNITM